MKQPKPPRRRQARVKSPAPPPDGDAEDAKRRLKPKGRLRQIVEKWGSEIAVGVAVSLITFTGKAVYDYATEPRWPVLICDVEYDPPGDEPDDEYVKLCNNSRGAVDLSDWTISDRTGSYKLPLGTKLLRGEQMVIFGKTYNPGRDPKGLWLSNEHETVRLLDRSGKVVDTYEW